jgi:hypothetical protein
MKFRDLIRKKEESTENRAFNQWKFVHGLLKTMIRNTLTSMQYIRYTPDGAAELYKVKNMRYPLLRKIYVAFMLGYDDWAKDRGIDISQGTHYQIKKGFQMCITMIESDHIYHKLVEFMYKRFNTLTEKNIEDYAIKELKQKPEKKEDFMFFQPEKEVKKQ